MREVRLARKEACVTVMGIPGVCVCVCECVCAVSHACFSSHCSNETSQYSQHGPDK